MGIASENGRRGIAKTAPDPRRRHAVVVVAVSLCEGGRTVHGRALDLGCAGVFLDSEERLPKGAACRVELRGDVGGHDRVVSLEGRVAPTEARGVCVRLFPTTGKRALELAELVDAVVRARLTGAPSKGAETGREQRAHPRVSVKVSARATDSGGRVEYGWVRNISEGGMLFHGDGRLAVGARRTFHLHVSEAGRLSNVAVDGTVVRADDGRVGVRFERVDAEAMAALRELIAAFSATVE